MDLCSSHWLAHPFLWTEHFFLSFPTWNLSSSKPCSSTTQYLEAIFLGCWEYEPLLFHVGPCLLPFLNLCLLWSNSYSCRPFFPHSLLVTWLWTVRVWNTAQSFQNNATASSNSIWWMSRQLNESWVRSSYTKLNSSNPRLDLESISGISTDLTNDHQHLKNKFVSVH